MIGVSPLDAPTVDLVAIVRVTTAALAMAGPAWRAVRIDPATALRDR